MATVYGDGVRRKKIATYGKTARKRIPEFNFSSASQKSQSQTQTPEVEVELEAETESEVTAPLAKRPTHSPNVNGFHQRPSSRTPSSASPVRGGDIFDVPSSDEEVFPTPRKLAPKVSKKTTVDRLPKNANPKEVPEVRAENMEGRKRAKLSPARKAPLKPPLKAPSTKATTSKPLPRSPAANIDNKSPETLFVSTVVARPKLKADQAQSKAPRAPPMVSISPSKKLQSGTPSPQLSDVDMMDMDPDSKYMSPKGLLMWKGLLNSVDANEEGDAMDISVEPVQSSRSQLKASVTYEHRKSPSKLGGISKPQQSPRHKLPRRRLIDSLVEQSRDQDDTDEDDSEENTSESMPDVSPSLAPPSTLEDVPMSQSLATATQDQPDLPPSSQNSQTTGPKITYSRQRSMLAEADLMQQLALDMPTPPVQGSQGRRPRRGEIPKLPLPLSFQEDDEDGEGTGAAIRSVHELRQAGANSRFLDEVEDFLDRVGSPNATKPSTRRSGLLDIACKLKDKNFTRQFRANNVEQRLFVHLGQETDVIAGYLMVSMLVTVLVDGSVPPFVAQLRRQGIARLLIRLLDVQSGIVAVAKERKSNMSKIGQKLLSEHHEYMLQLPIWEDLQPQILSPQTIALKCLEIMVRQTREAGHEGDVFSKELTTKIFAILKSAPEDSSWDLPRSQQAIDFHLALSALESHSIRARTVRDESIWITDYLPIIADALEVGLTRPVDGFGVLQLLLLRLTLNVTNNNPKASDVFAREVLMSAMGQAIVAKFKMIFRFLTEEDFSVAVDHLILVLGVMINFAEWSSAARESLQNLQGDTSDPLDSMIQTFIDNQERTSMAESVEESQKNVAFGYFSVLLGYLSLLPAISQRIENRQRNTPRLLVASIEEFIGHHKAVDLIAADQEGYNPQTGLTQRLESLVDKLRML
ncbi:uncharacterized protein BP5553_07030 [Venustampulla echinocandica]|uniref:Wings apart-like protein C-terminal domain-containing protein n=1 Tax=Venustampulla echinocandica TaxID=2656787 RepID=A0A370TIB7_9HELO|nr:uncharacterized protein BP5553_07030 [Venustampulla echinocandica]RDL35099.1 hypothetical protein BP5553_07030 [Venustampulla echinocandica]